MTTRNLVTSASRRVVVAALGTLLLLSGTARAAVTQAGAEGELMRLVNEARSQAGQPALTRDPAIDPIAREWSAEMARTGVFDHRPDLGPRIAQAEPQSRAWAENIAWRQPSGALADADVVAVHNGLLASPRHYANIIGDYNRVGVGVAISGNRIWVTFDFLRGPALAGAQPPPSQPPPPSPTPPPKAPPAAGSGGSATASAPAPPFGWFRMTRGPGRRVRVVGWAIDPNTTKPIRVRVRVGRRVFTQTASRDRRDVARVFPQMGPRHGFSLGMRARRGARICVDAIEPGTEKAVTLDCRRLAR